MTSRDRFNAIEREWDNLVDDITSKEAALAKGLEELRKSLGVDR